MGSETRLPGELGEYVCGGYYIVKTASNSGPVEFCEICKAKLPPGEIVTVSTCLTVTLPHTWAYEWIDMTDDERKQSGQIWGLRHSDLEQFIKWTTERQRAGEIGWPNQLRTLDTARELLRRFPISRNGWRLLGLGLRRNNATSFVAPYAPKLENESPPSIAEAIGTGVALAPSGHIIGYEVLAWEVDGFHSWFCSLSEKDVSQELAISPGSDGLLESYDDAVRVAAAAVRPHDAAPFGSIDWYPWAVVNYPP